MTHQYESEILNKLMERDGFNIPSSVPPYEAEIKAYLINQVKQAYPKLTDYEAEWLLYNYTKHLPADFPISSVSNVTEASFENVVPFAYQSAILKGQTLVNLSLFKEFVFSGSNNSDAYDCAITLQINKSYIMLFDLTNSTSVANTDSIAVRGWLSNGDYREFGRTIKKFDNGRNFVKITSTEGDIVKLLITCSFATEMKNIMVIEYQDGMENWDIPYFEGMQSVKMPVLTTTGKNLFNVGTIKKGYTLSANNGLEVINARRYTSDFIYVKGLTHIAITSPERSHNMWGYDENKQPVIKLNDGGIIRNFVISIPSNITYVRIPFSSINQDVITDEIIQNNLVQVEAGEQFSSYEPFKSNILTVNEDVELRGVGDVKDGLDLLTGEVTQRIGGVVLNGSEGWSIASKNFSDGYIYQTPLPLKPIAKNNVICDKLQPKTVWGENTGEGIGINGSLSHLQIKHSTITTVADFKAWLASSPITVQYGLENPNIKTVDLKTVNESRESVHFMPFEGTMNVQSSGEIIQPTFDMSVPVEATTQNLFSFINLEMEE